MPTSTLTRDDAGYVVMPYADLREAELNGAKLTDANLRPERHPRVLDILAEYAHREKAKGHRKCGIGFLFELARWGEEEIGRDVDGFRLNNSLRAYAARELMNVHPDLAGFFEVRRLRA
jgi:hypothetical protein